MKDVEPGDFVQVTYQGPESNEDIIEGKVRPSNDEYVRIDTMNRNYHVKENGEVFELYQGMNLRVGNGAEFTLIES